jgi:hypothetical protein
MNEPGSGLERHLSQEGRAQASALSMRPAYLAPTPDQAAPDRPRKGPLASTVGMVRDTLYATFDALRGRYDR